MLYFTREGMTLAQIGAFELVAITLLIGIAVALGLAVACTFREPPLSATEATTRPHAWDTLRAGALIALHDAQLRPVLLRGSIFGLFVALIWMTILQPYTMSMYVPVWTFGMLLLMSRHCRMAGAYLAPRLAATMPRLRLLTIAAGIMALSLVGLWLGTSPATLALIGIISAASAAVLPVLSAMLNDAIPSAQRATIISLQSLVTMLGLAGVQWVFFVLSQRVSAPFAAGFCGLLLALLVTPVLWTLRRSHPVRSETLVEPSGSA